MARLRITGGEKVPASGACVLAPNHYSEIDPIVVAVALWRLGRAPRFLAKEALFRVPGIGMLLRASGQIPVTRGGASRGSVPLESARRLLERGESIIIYPEGSLTRDPNLWPMRGKTGAVRVALEQGIPLIPLAHWGTQQLMGRYGRRLRVFPRSTIQIKIGDPVDLSAFRGKPLEPAVLTAATSTVMAAITALLEDLRHEQAPPRRWDPNEHRQTETGRLD